MGIATSDRPPITTLPISPMDLSVARLDLRSELFRRRVAAENAGWLEARIWGAPAPQTIHGWALPAAEAAWQLDRSVPVRGRLGSLGASAVAAAHDGRERRPRTRLLRP